MGSFIQNLPVYFMGEGWSPPGGGLPTGGGPSDYRGLTQGVDSHGNALGRLTGYDASGRPLYEGQQGSYQTRYNGAMPQQLTQAIGQQPQQQTFYVTPNQPLQQPERVDAAALQNAKYYAVPEAVSAQLNNPYGYSVSNKPPQYGVAVEPAVVRQNNQGIDFGAIAAQTPEGAKNYPTLNINATTDLSKAPMRFELSAANQFYVQSPSQMNASSIELSLPSFLQSSFLESREQATVNAQYASGTKFNAGAFGTFLAVGALMYGKGAVRGAVDFPKIPFNIALSFGESLGSPKTLLEFPGKLIGGTVELVAEGFGTNGVEAAGYSAGQFTLGPKFAELIPSIKPGEVKLGDASVYTGVYAERGTRATPLLGVSGGSIKVGGFEFSPETIEAVKQVGPLSGGDKGGIVQTPIQYRFAEQVARQTFQNKGSITDFTKDVTVPGTSFEFQRLQSGVETARQTQRISVSTPSSFNVNVATLAGYPKTQAGILNLINREPDIVVYGSGLQKSLLGEKMERQPNDYDISAKDATAFANEVEKVFKQAGEAQYKREATKSGELISVEIFGKEGTFAHAVDIHSMTGSSGYSLFPETKYYGYGFKPLPLIDIGGVKAMSLGEQGFRKGVSSVTIRPEEGRVNPEPHRMKDIGDFVLVQKALIESGKKSLNPVTQVRARIAEGQLGIFEATRPELKAVSGSRELLFVKQTPVVESFGYSPAGLVRVSSSSSPAFDVAKLYGSPSLNIKQASPSPGYSVGSSSPSASIKLSSPSPSFASVKSVSPGFRQVQGGKPSPVFKFQANQVYSFGVPVSSKPPTTPITPTNNPPYAFGSKNNPNVPFVPTRTSETTTEPIVLRFNDSRPSDRKKRLTLGFVPEIRRKGKFRAVAGPTDLFSAFNLGAAAVKASIASTFRARPAGTIEADESTNPFAESKEFRFLKKNQPYTLTQRRGFRLGSFGERREIQASRKKKNWLGF